MKWKTGGKSNMESRNSSALKEMTKEEENMTDEGNIAKQGIYRYRLKYMW